MKLSEVRRRWERGYGMLCSEPTIASSMISWDCRSSSPDGGGALQVRLLATALDRIVSIEALAFQFAEPDDRRVIRLLAPVAVLPYRGAQPIEAMAWIREHLPCGGQTTIGGVTFTIYGTGSARTLELKASGYK